MHTPHSTPRWPEPCDDHRQEHLQTLWPGVRSQGQFGCGQEPRGCREVRRARLITGETQRPWLWVCAGEGSRPHHIGPGNQMFSQLRLRAEHKPAEKPMAGVGGDTGPTCCTSVLLAKPNSAQEVLADPHQGGWNPRRRPLGPGCFLPFLLRSPYLSPSPAPPPRVDRTNSGLFLPPLLASTFEGREVPRGERYFLRILSNHTAPLAPKSPVFVDMP